MRLTNVFAISLSLICLTLPASGWSETPEGAELITNERADPFEVNMEWADSNLTEMEHSKRRNYYELAHIYTLTAIAYKLDEISQRLEQSKPWDSSANGKNPGWECVEAAPDGFCRLWKRLEKLEPRFQCADGQYMSRSGTCVSKYD